MKEEELQMKEGEELQMNGLKNIIKRKKVWQAKNWEE